MTINIKNFLNDKTKLSKMGEFQSLKQIEGLEMASISADLYKDGRDDLALFYFTKGANYATLTTSNSITSEFIPWNNNSHKKIIKGLLVNTKNANTFTGKQGKESIDILAKNLSRVLTIKESKNKKGTSETVKIKDLIFASTGVIGEEFPVEKIRERLPDLVDRLNLECKNLEGVSLKERLKNFNNKQTNRSYIFSKAKPINKQGGIVVLFGSLAPEGAILKRAAATSKLLEHEGKALVFTSLKDLSNRIDDPNLKVSEKDILILRNAGPSTDSGMPEAGYLPIPKKLAKKGVKDMVRISDARMSGTAFGTIILHVTPEGSKKGPLSIVKTGDKIKLSEKNKTIDLMVSKKEIQKRFQKLKLKKNQFSRGYKKLYLESILPASEGCDFNFL